MRHVRFEVSVEHPSGVKRVVRDLPVQDDEDPEEVAELVTRRTAAAVDYLALQRKGCSVQPSEGKPLTDCLGPQDPCEGGPG